MTSRRNPEITQMVQIAQFLLGHISDTFYFAQRATGLRYIERVIGIGNLTFMGPCIVEYSNIYPTRCNVTQLILSGNSSTCFGVVPSPIIRSANNSIYSIWYLSDRYWYLPLAAGSTNGLTNTRCCRYSCLRSWWWVEVPPETCRAVFRYK